MKFEQCQCTGGGLYAGAVFLKGLVDPFVGVLNAVYSRIGVVENGVEEIF